MTQDTMTAAATTAAFFGRCSGCGYLMYPILPLCPGGDDGEIDTVELTDAGIVYSWTGQPGSAQSDGRWFAMADFFDGRLRIVAPLVGSQKVEIGTRVKALETPDGLPVLRPV